MLLSSAVSAQEIVETVAGPKATGYLGLGKSPVWSDEVFQTADLPKTFDWREVSDVVTPVRSQGNCGSCVSFGLAKSFEGALMVQTGRGPYNFAEQEILSCRKGDAFGCNGAYMTAAGYVSTKGLGSEEDFPYRARAVACKKIDTVEKAESYKLLNRASKEVIKAALIKYGPMFVTVQAGGRGWSGRTGKITSCKKTNGSNHVLTLIGYDEKGWILRNSWGTGWGDGGDSWIGYNCDGVAKQAGYFVVN